MEPVVALRFDRSKLGLKRMSDDDIRRRAYQMWLDQGQPEGLADRHWEEARLAMLPPALELSTAAAGTPPPVVEVPKSAAPPKPVLTRSR